MTTRQRLDLLARAYPRLFPRAELMRLVQTQLGGIDALEKWIVRDSLRLRARAPRLIYHICAGNLAVSAWTSLAHGLLLGARNIVKLPGEREDSTARREILDFITDLPAPLRKLIETHRTFDPKIFAQADAIIAFGSDTTMSTLRAQAHWDQKFIAHGHALSLLFVPEPLTKKEAQSCATDILTYDQLGCLSPQSIYIAPDVDLIQLGDLLAPALERHWHALPKKPARPLAVAARIAEARDVARALGHRLWLPPKNHLGWTIIHDPDPTFRPSPLHGVIYLHKAASPAQLRQALAPVAGRISTIGIAGGSKTSSRWLDLFLSLGVSRFCEAGRMQFPPLTWHHDGRAVLAELVTWVDADGRI